MNVRKATESEMTTPRKIVSIFKDAYIPVSSVFYSLDNIHSDRLPVNVEKIYITYPVRNPVIVEVPGITTYGDLIEATLNAYVEIYRIEGETSTKKEAKLCDEVPGCLLTRRNETDGEFGIWGHWMKDLYARTWIFYDDGLVRVEVDSHD